MPKIGKSLIALEEKVSMLLLIFIVVLVFLAALLRWFGYPLPWSVDMAQLLFVWFCFLGADQALRKDKHIGVDVLTRYLPLKAQRIIQLCFYIMIFLFLGLIVIYGVHLSYLNRLRQFNGMKLSYSWATVSAPVGCSIMMLTTVGKIRRFLKPVTLEENKQTKPPDDKDEINMARG